MKELRIGANREGVYHPPFIDMQASSGNLMDKQTAEMLAYAALVFRGLPELCSLVADSRGVRILAIAGVGTAMAALGTGYFHQARAASPDFHAGLAMGPGTGHGSPDMHVSVARGAPLVPVLSSQPDNHSFVMRGLPVAPMMGGESRFPEPPAQGGNGGSGQTFEPTPIPTPVPTMTPTPDFNPWNWFSQQWSKLVGVPPTPTPTETSTLVPPESRVLPDQATVVFLGSDYIHRQYSGFAGAYPEAATQLTSAFNVVTYLEQLPAEGYTQQELAAYTDIQRSTTSIDGQDVPTLVGTDKAGKPEVLAMQQPVNGVETWVRVAGSKYQGHMVYAYVVPGGKDDLGLVGVTPQTAATVMERLMEEAARSKINRALAVPPDPNGNPRAVTQSQIGAVWNEAQANGGNVTLYVPVMMPEVDPLGTPVVSGTPTPGVPTTFGFNEITVNVNEPTTFHIIQSDAAWQALSAEIRTHAVSMFLDDKVLLTRGENGGLAVYYVDTEMSDTVSIDAVAAYVQKEGKTFSNVFKGENTFVQSRMGSEVSAYFELTGYGQGGIALWNTRRVLDKQHHASPVIPQFDQRLLDATQQFVDEIMAAATSK